MLTFAIIFITSALLLYTIAIWSERIARALKPWMFKVFVFAFVCDLVGTSLMFYQANAKFQLNIHSACGYSALAIMGLHLAWATIALKRRGRAEEYFHRFSLLAWSVWLLAFMSGIPRA